MKKITLSANAKINLSLDVFQKQNNYHPLSSFVCSLSLCDTITLTKRNDHRISIKTLGIPVGCSKRDNNAALAAQQFMKKFEVVGVDITITKNIPVGGGLGGSSADIVGVLKGLKALFETKDDITPLANAMGSDCAYMLEGGFAKMEGRGEIVTKIPTDRKLYFIIISEDMGISAKECYAEFDKINRPSLPCTDRAIDLFLKGDDQFYSCIKNDLFESSLSLLPVLQDNIDALKKAGAQASLMTGSGSSVYGVFSDKRLRDNAYKKLKKAYGDRLIKTESV